MWKVKFNGLLYIWVGVIIEIVIWFYEVEMIVIKIDRDDEINFFEGF